MDRKQPIERIRKALRQRSGKQWSVTGGRGTAWGWLRIDAPPARRKYDFDGKPGGSCMHPDERVELGKLLGLERVHQQGVSIPSSNDYWQEYIDRAEGRVPTRVGTPYWD